MERLKDLPIGSVFSSLEETGGFAYRKLDKVDQFGSILCIPINYNPFPEPHWHSKNEKVEQAGG